VRSSGGDAGDLAPGTPEWVTVTPSPSDQTIVCRRPVRGEEGESVDRAAKVDSIVEAYVQVVRSDGRK
jgi:hypothetical protein